MAKKNRQQRRSGTVAQQRTGPQDARVLSQQVMQEISASFSGPLPPPDLLRGYEEEFPGLAERIIRHSEIPLEMAQRQQEHRIKLETKVITGDSKRSWVGLVLGFVVAMTAIVGGIVLVLNDKSVEGLAAIIGALGGIIGSFIYSQRHRQADLDQRKPR